MGGFSRKVRRNAARSCGHKALSKSWGIWEERGSFQGLGAPSHLHHFTKTYSNDVYAVLVAVHDTAWGKVEQAQIRRHDGKPSLPWSDMQRIKDELFGPERCGLEVYPEESKLVDQADCYHLWVLPEGATLPFTLNPSNGGGIRNSCGDVVQPVPENLVGGAS